MTLEDSYHALHEARKQAMKRRAIIAGIICACIVVAVSCAESNAILNASVRMQSRPTATVPLGASATTTPVATATTTRSAPPGWVTILDDEFNTPGVPSHWSLYNGSYGDSAHNCAAPSQVQVPGDGYLHLKMQYLSSGICGPGWYTGGMQVSSAYGGVDQAITVRWRIVPSADPGAVHSHRIIPMRWVDDPNYPWYRGESNYCEGSALGGCYTFLHYGPNSRQITKGYLIDLTKWHTWRIEVRNHKVSVFIDNMTNPVWVYNGNETTTPDSLKRTVLQQECPLSGCPSAAYKGDVEDIQIDWITIENATGANPAPNGIIGPLQAGQAGHMASRVSTASANRDKGAFANSVAAPLFVRALSTAVFQRRRLGVSSRADSELDDT